MNGSVNGGTMDNRKLGERDASDRGHHKRQGTRRVGGEQTEQVGEGTLAPKLIVAFVVVAVLAIGGFALWRTFGAQEPQEEPQEEVKVKHEVPIDAKSEARVERLMADLSLEQKVAQLFIDGELRGFQKIGLEPGESKTVEIVPVPCDDTDYPDTYTVPKAPEKYPVTLESRFTDLRQTFMGRILFNYSMSVSKKMEKEAMALPDGTEKDNRIKGAQFMKKMIESNSPRSLTMESGLTFPYNFAQAFVELTNGHFFKGIGLFMKKIDVPKLPKEQSQEK